MICKRWHKVDGRLHGRPYAMDCSIRRMKSLDIIEIIRYSPHFHHAFPIIHRQTFYLGTTSLISTHLKVHRNASPTGFETTLELVSDLSLEFLERVFLGVQRQDVPALRIHSSGIEFADVLNWLVVRTWHMRGNFCGSSFYRKRFIFLRSALLSAAVCVRVPSSISRSRISSSSSSSSSSSLRSSKVSTSSPSSNDP